MMKDNAALFGEVVCLWENEHAGFMLADGGVTDGVSSPLHACMYVA